MPQDEPENRETKIATAIKALSPRELDAYRYFLRAKQSSIAEDAADRLYQLYLQGQSCEDIRRVAVGFSLGQVVAARIVGEWDSKVAGYRENLVANVPIQAEQTHLEAVDFLGNLLKATYMKYGDKIRKYLATGDEAHLIDVPLPKSVREFGAVMDLFMKSTGQDKRRVEVSGTLKVDHRNGTATAVSSEEAAGILDALMADAIDVKAEAVKKLEPVKK